MTTNFLTVPADYKCMECSATGCKLWREYQTFVPDLLCARCAAKRGNKDISDMDSEGLHSSKMVCNSRRTVTELTLTTRYNNAKFSAGAQRLPRKLKKRLKKDFDRGYELVPTEMDMGRSDQIGWFVPAVPDEEGVGYWGYTSVPEEGCIWWRKLPTFPEDVVHLKYVGNFTPMGTRPDRLVVQSPGSVAGSPGAADCVPHLAS